ncbi:hypothetical protein N9L68_08595 [bacterium]|nr:hypothetical protein [bacterium]
MPVLTRGGPKTPEYHPEDTRKTFRGGAAKGFPEVPRVVFRGLQAAPRAYWLKTGRITIIILMKTIE